MGKKRGASWLTAVKRAFRSPSKDTEKKGSNRREQQDVVAEEEKKREKKRWLFRKPSNSEPVQQSDSKQTTTSRVSAAAAGDQRHAIAVAVATAAAAEAAVATAQAAVEVVRLTRPSNFIREQYAALVIQTAFRGYLARRALRALKGLVKLQALVRGHNVRKQANMTLRCMQALVRVQARVREQRLKLSQEGSTMSSLGDSNSLWQSRYLQEMAERKSMSRDGSSVEDDWVDRPHTVDKIQAMLQSRNEAALKREKTLAYAFSHQIWNPGKNPSISEEAENEERLKWLERWMETRSWENRGRASTDHRNYIKTIEIDAARSFSRLNTNIRKHQNYNHQQHPSVLSLSSPLHRSHKHPSIHQSTATSSPAKARPIQVRSASPRSSREDKASPAVHTPSSVYCYSSGFRHRETLAAAGNSAEAATIPNYMAATESARARIRSLSAPRQRPLTPERERGSSGGFSARKRLSFPVSELWNSGGGGVVGFGERLRSPTFKCVHGATTMMEQHSNLSSCCTDSYTGQVSPSSTTDLRR